MAAPIRVTKGSKEPWAVDVSDALGHLTSLDGTDLRFSIYKADQAETPVIVNASSDSEGMTALPLVDTSANDFDEGYYDLFITFVSSPDQPRLGPFRFLVD